MRPALTRATLIGALLLTLAVAANALLFQSGGPGRAAAERVRQAAEADRARRLAIDKMPEAVKEAKKPDVPALAEKPAAKEPPVPARLSGLKSESFNAAVMKVEPAFGSNTGDAAPDTIRAIQRELIQRGYGPITQDGVPGLSTRAAILAFEKDAGFALTAEASDALLKRILLGASADRNEAANAGKVKSTQAEQVIRTVQQSLAGLGYQPGKIDGRVGEESERAIREFEMDQGTTPTGRVSADLVVRLSRAAGAGKLSAAR